MKTKSGIKIIKLILACLITFQNFNVKAQVKIWEEPTVIPTLKVGEPALHPTFKRKIDMRADEDQIYPYLYNSNITSEYEDKTYNGCFLENEYIKVLVTPDIGGKLYGARDKTNDYNFFYWQPTVKPALISLTGPWVSGGIEWCFPSGHRQTCYQPIGYRLTEQEDGSKTIWVGETEWVHGLRWLVGLTAYPGKSVLEAKVRLINPTNMPQSQYMWAIAATHADSSYQMIYPTEYMTTHNRASFTKWPIEGGINHSWWKNIPNASSYFAEDLGGFFGGYDHNKDAGTAFVGNKHIVIGKKFWTWGSSSSGRLWDWVLSDGGGPYVEPQAGAYTTNQPGFHWLNPGEERHYSHYFFPVKGIGGFKTANINGALNLEFHRNSMQVGVYSTAELSNANVRLLYKKELVFDKSITISPSKPFSISLPKTRQDTTNYTLLFTDVSGKILLSYSPEIRKSSEKPEAVTPFKIPQEYNSSDEQWNIGEYLYRNRDKNRAENFFHEILKKDSLDTRANVSMAQIHIEKAEYQKALEHLENANVRNTDNGKLYYLKGVAQLSIGNYQHAYNAFYRSTHFQDYYPQGYEQVAKIDLYNGNLNLAYKHTLRAMEKNSKSSQLWVLKAIIHRLKNQYDKALTACDSALVFDPLNFRALNERIIISKIQNKPYEKDLKLLKQLLLDDHQYYIELSRVYLETGIYNEAIETYELFQNLDVNESALIYYYKAYCFDKQEKISEARSSLKKAQNTSIINVFPFRRKSIDIFKTALKYDSLDANAHYFLGLTYAGLLNGNFAFLHLKKASELNSEQAKTWRNLGFLKYGYPGVSKDLNMAKKYYEKAFALAPDDDLILKEFDRVKMDLNEDPYERLKFLKKHIDVVEKNDDLLTTMLDLMVVFGEYKTPIKYYNNHVFNNREGKYDIHNSYMNAYIGMAKEAKKPKIALEYYKKANEYPDNLKVKPRNPNLRGFLFYPMGQLYKKLGSQDEAKRLFSITANENTNIPTLSNYYQALAIKELGQDHSKSEQLIEELEKEAHALIKGKAEGYLEYEDKFKVALGHYYLSLIHNYKNNLEQSGKELKIAQDLFLKIERNAIMLAQKNYK